MRKIFALTIASAFLLFAGAAQAGTLTSATWSGSFQGVPFTLTTGGGGLSASGTSGNGTANVSVTIAPFTLSITDTTGQAPTFISQVLGGNQAITVNGTNAGATQGLAGNVNVFIGINSNGTLLFPVALSVGVTPAGGNPFFQTTAVVPGLNIPVEVTASAFAWQVNQYTFANSTVSGNTFVTTTTPSGATNQVPIPTFAATGSNSLTSNGGGTVTLIAPSVTTVCVGAIFGSFPCVPGAAGNQQSSISAGVTTLTLNFVPEPGTLLMLGAGLAGLIALGRRQKA